MRRYETIVIVDPDIGEDQREIVFDRVRELVPQKGGLVVELDEWGARKMAYEVKKKKRGYYLRVDYCGNGELVDEMERQFRIDDRVLKYMTVLLEDDVNMESIQEQMAQATASEAPAAEAPAAKTAATTEEAPAEEAPTSAPEETPTSEDSEPAADKEDN